MFVSRPDRAEIYWTDRGQGSEVVLSHGLFSDHHILDEQAGALDLAGFRVLQWDLRAHGQSTRSTTGPSFADLVDDLAAVIEASGFSAPVLVGQGLGGVLSLALVLARPEQFGGLALWSVDTATTPAVDRATAALMTAARTVTIRPITLAMEPLWIRRADGHDPALAALQRRTATTLSPGALAQLALALEGRPDLRKRLREVRIPTQVLWGDRDRLIRPQAGRELLTGIHHAEGGAVPDAAHLLQVDQPQTVDELLVRFVQRAFAGSTSRA